MRRQKSITLQVYSSSNLRQPAESNYVYIIGVLDSVVANPHIHADLDNAAMPTSLVVFQGTVLLSRTLTVLLVYANFGTNLENKRIIIFTRLHCNRVEKHSQLSKLRKSQATTTPDYILVADAELVRVWTLGDFGPMAIMSRGAPTLKTFDHGPAHYSDTQVVQELCTSLCWGEVQPPPLSEILDPSLMYFLK